MVGLWPLLGSLLLSTVCAAVPLLSTALAVPAGASRFYTIAPSPGLVAVQLSLCSPPTAVIPLATLPNSFFVSTDPAVTAPGQTAGGTLGIALRRGFANTTVDASRGVSIGVWAPAGATGLWNYELSVTAAITPPVVLGSAASFYLDDTDATTALLTTSNFTDVDVSSPIPSFTPVVLPSTGLSNSLAFSLCYLQNYTKNAVAKERIVANLTTRGFGGGVRVQYEVGGLLPGTNYTSWLLGESTNAAGDKTTTLLPPTYFVTKTGNSCRLVHSLDFCPSVAYAVPSPPQLASESLIAFYNNTLQPSLQAFARSLSTFPCNDITMGAYSFISTCNDCMQAYTDWVCAVGMPRCTDSIANPEIDGGQIGYDAGNSTEWFLPTTLQQTILRVAPPISRSPLLSTALLATTFANYTNASTLATLTTPFPYQEVLPCVQLCHLVAARCPSFLKFTCPLLGGTLTAGYGVPEYLPTSDMLAGDEQFGSGLRGGDRFGNVFCNSLGTDLRMAIQLFEPSRSAAPPSLRIHFCAALPLLLIFLSL